MNDLQAHMLRFSPDKMEEVTANGARRQLEIFIAEPTPSNRSAFLGHLDGYQEAWIRARVSKPEAAE